MSKTTDLLGDPTPEPPPMNAPLPWRVFQMNDFDWWMARTLAEAKETYQRETGVSDEEMEDAVELTDAQMHALTIKDDDEQPPVTQTFHEYLRDCVKHRAEPGLFASTEG